MSKLSQQLDRSIARRFCRGWWNGLGSLERRLDLPAWVSPLPIPRGVFRGPL